MAGVESRNLTCIEKKIDIEQNFCEKKFNFQMYEKKGAAESLCKNKFFTV